MNERYSSPKYDCDVIMKGGITSGIVYPPALAEIASDHRLHGVGGTSAGAIAAAAAAAAELGRHSTSGGFGYLEQLPNILKEVDGRNRTKLFRLFQPQHGTRSSFALIWNYRTRSRFGKIAGLLIDLARMAAGVTPIWTPLIMLLGVAFAAVALALAGPYSLIVGVPIVAISVVTAGAVRLAHLIPDRLAANFFGLCNGTTPTDSDDPALTDWLHEQIQRLAGRYDDGVAAESRKVPVTFGELADHGVELVVLSTNVSRGTSETIPFREQVWAYDPEELGALFPQDVMRHLAAHAHPPSDTAQQAELDRLGLTALPRSEQLPIIVAARMSLSFPVLLSAVPLHGLTPNRSTDGWDLTFVRNWFSDGGITSNLPVQLFDAVLPSRPTYGINLSGGADPAATNPADNIWRPMAPRQGGLPPTAVITSIAGLLGGVFDTMQNWADNDDSRAVGFRDRICTVRLAASEGGMNLDMPPELIAGLVAKGACAGDNLASIQRGERACRSDNDQPSEEQLDIEANQWERHRWIRFRMAVAGLSHLVQGMGSRWDSTAESTGYRDLAGGVTPDAPTWQSYRSDWSVSRANGYLQHMDATLDDGTLGADWLVDGQPAGFSVGFGPDRGAGQVEASQGGSA